MKTIAVVSVCLLSVMAWDINKTDPTCTGNINVPGILNIKDGSLFGGRSKIACLPKYCTCNVAASGSILPPRVNQLTCSDGKCVYALNGNSLSRLGSDNCQPEVIKNDTC